MIVKAAFCQELIEKELQPFKDLPFSFFWDNRPSEADLSINEINIYGHSEPNEYFGNASWILKTYHFFDAVLTWDPEVLRVVGSSIFCPFGTSAFHDKVINNLNIDGDKRVSFIRGNKHFPVPGHDLRWQLWNRRNEIINTRTEFFSTTTPEYASNPQEELQWLEQRRHIFQDNMFHIAIENTSQPNYFTEKIMDCFLFRTVPIYYGCSNINDFFNPNGIITFTTVDELIDICNNLTFEDYSSRIDAIYDNNVRCQQYLNLGKTIHDKLKPFLIEKGLL